MARGHIAQKIKKTVSMPPILPPVFVLTSCKPWYYGTHVLQLEACFSRSKLTKNPASRWLRGVFYALISFVGNNTA